MNRNTPSRRTVLGGVASTLVALAGCTEADQPEGTGDPFQEVVVEETAVVVTLAADSDVDRVNLIDPDGSRVGSSEVGSGETRLQFDLGTSYTPGTFDIVAESGGETSIDIRPEIRIQEVGVGVNHLDRMPDSLGNTQEQEALVVVKNLGNGPVGILALAFSGDVPNPSEEVQPGSKSGIFDAEEGKGERNEVSLSGGNKVTLYSSTLPFSLAAEGESCESMPTTGTAETQLYTSVSEQPHVARFNIRYTKTDSSDECRMLIQERSE